MLSLNITLCYAFRQHVITQSHKIGQKLSRLRRLNYLNYKRRLYNLCRR